MSASEQGIASGRPGNGSQLNTGMNQPRHPSRSSFAARRNIFAGLTEHTEVPDIVCRTHVVSLDHQT